MDPRCRNCQHPLAAPPHYCPACGAKVIHERLRVGHLLEQGLASVFNVDNRFWQTFLTLLHTPSRVALSYIAGVRKRYLAPLPYFVFITALYGLFFLVADSDKSGYFHEQFIRGFFEGAEKSVAWPQVAARLRVFSLPIMLATIPLCALATWFLYRKTDYNYAEHLVLNTYWLAQFILADVVFQVLDRALSSLPLPDQLFNLLLLPLLTWFTYRLHIPVFQSTSLWRFAKPLVFMLAFLVLMSIFYISIGYLTVTSLN
ncbi:Protein of unknown function [Catalinimonas alkaloidigena]|uniref:DUF3667 domain-containing protein n=1 Tax=Catalinimonas alkaloidigena TaxID=1075417 RepID=A0A1G9UDD9_9BACT|nr:DUF3667 domain-containing protein [Catalinimonas alkaloidigena]SDM57939.1 Protein of unknown function [Catalinimonas alkaloidigena]